MLTTFVPVGSGALRPLRARLAGAALIGLWLASAPTGAARAEQILVGDCLHSGGGLTCAVRWGKAGDPYIRTVPGPRDAREEAEFAKRDQNWQTHCRPVVKPDRFGVDRYQYAATGCEFGVAD